MKIPRSSPCTTGCTTYTPAMTSDSWTSANRLLLGEVDGRVNRSSTRVLDVSRPALLSSAPVQPDCRARDHHRLEELRELLGARAMPRCLPQRQRVEAPRLVDSAAVEVVGARLLDRHDRGTRRVGHQREIDR